MVNFRDRVSVPEKYEERFFYLKDKVERGELIVRMWGRCVKTNPIYYLFIRA